MTTYRTRDNQQFERYEKFTIKRISALTWIPLLVGENRVRYFESSQLVEIVDPRMTGMVYTCAIPQNFDSGLDYCYPMPAPLTVVLTPEMAASVNHVIGVDILVRNPAPTLFHSTMKEAA